MSIEDKIVWGGLYTSPFHNDQSNGYCVPIYGTEGRIWMQDTYQIQYPSVKYGQSKTEAAIEQVLSFADKDRCEANQWNVNHARGNYYYKNQELIINESSLDSFEFIADLHDYRALKHGEDENDYAEEDVLRNVRLYFVHGYSWSYGNIGVSLVRKGAQKNGVSQIMNAVNKMNDWFKAPYSGTYDCDIESLNNLVKDYGGSLSEFQMNRLNRAMSTHYFLKDMQEKYNAHIKELDKKFPLNWEEQ